MQKWNDYDVHYHSDVTVSLPESEWHMTHVGKLTMTDTADRRDEMMSHAVALVDIENCVTNLVVLYFIC